MNEPLLRQQGFAGSIPVGSTAEKPKPHLHFEAGGASGFLRTPKPPGIMSASLESVPGVDARARLLRTRPLRARLPPYLFRASPPLRSHCPYQSAM